MRILEGQSGAVFGTTVREYFYTTPALRLRLDLVREYVLDGMAPVLVSGDPGAGKSAFLDQIVRRADSCWRLVRVPAFASFSPSEVLSYLNTELRLPISDSSDSLIGELDQYLEKIAVRGRIAVIAIDDAHELADASLARLVTLSETLRSANFRLLMTGLPALRSRLTALLADMRASVRPHVVTIPSLSDREVANYIDMKLYHAGVDGRGIFSRRVIDDIAHVSHGFPGRIDTMTRALLSGNRSSPTRRWTADRFRQLVGRLTDSGAAR